MALSGCISTIWAVVVKNSGVSYQRLTVELEADKPDDQPTITAARAVVTVESGETREKLQRVLDKTMDACPVGRLYEKAGIAVQTQLVVKGLPCPSTITARRTAIFRARRARALFSPAPRG
jgi:uncharacterized OsmC-like protein